MASLKHLLNSDDYANDAIRPPPFESQGPSITSLSSESEDSTPPVLQDGTWSNLYTDFHGTVVDSCEPFDFASFGGFDAQNGDSHQWQLNVEQWGDIAFPADAIDPLKDGNENIGSLSTGLTQPLNSFDFELRNRLCYGMIYRAAAKLTGNMSEARQKLHSESVSKIAGHAVLRVTHDSNGCWLLFEDGTKLAQLNAHLSKILPALLDLEEVEMDGLVDLITFRGILERATKSDEASIRVNINVYGTLKSKNVVGDELSASKIFLQQPDHPRLDCPYGNPHFLQLDFSSPDVALDTVDPVEAPAEKAPEQDFSSTLDNVYRSLKRGAHLQKLEADAALQTSLFPHQQEALDFMTQRETGPIPEQFCLWRREEPEQDGETCYRHLITKALSHEQPPETGGGVLADAMGLGKTLSVLSLIAKTRDAAQEWASRARSPDLFDSRIDKQSSRATLVLVSSYLLLNHWMSEVKRHLNGTFKVVKYHGQRRERKAVAIADSDIVITTYHTLAAEMAAGGSSLNEIAWYRIVLDEAHIIRHKQTTFYKTCLQLEAANRWCLSGTPIQNNLGDIGALFSFIKVRPFDDLRLFHSYVTAPFDDGYERRKMAAEKLTMLLDSLCLRRTRDVVELPEQREILRELDLTQPEREQYLQTKDMMNRAIRQRFGEIDRKNVFGLFQAQLQLRLFCNHGTFQNPFSWTNHRNMITERESALDLFGQSGEVTCACCHQPLPITSTNSTHNNSYRCRHVCCLECLEQTADGEEVDPELRALMCPVCETGSMGDRKKKRQRQNHNSETSIGYFREAGYSTKMQVLTADVQNEVWSNKSVIFSCWTRTLDLVEKHFLRFGLTFKRIDGDSPLHARQATLDAFSSNSDTPILLMTTGTGAYGLNIPVATRVFLVESQWNPHTERQAIARAMRLGQDHPIIVYRYVINQSVEQEMRSQQERKLHIAEVGWGS